MPATQHIPLRLSQAARTKNKAVNVVGYQLKGAKDSVEASQSFSCNPHWLWQARVDQVDVEMAPEMTLKILVSAAVLQRLARVFPNKSSQCHIARIKYRRPLDLQPTYKFDVCLPNCLQHELGIEKGENAIKVAHISQTLMICCFGYELFWSMVHYLSKLTMSVFLKRSPRDSAGVTGPSLLGWYYWIECHYVLLSHRSMCNSPVFILTT